MWKCNLLQVSDSGKNTLKHQAACETTDGSRGPTSGIPQVKRCSSSSSLFPQSSFRAQSLDFQRFNAGIKSPVYVINGVVEVKYVEL